MNNIYKYKYLKYKTKYQNLTNQDGGYHDLQNVDFDTVVRNIAEPWFSYIISREKTIFCTLYTTDIAFLKPNSYIKFVNEQNISKREIKVKVTSAAKYNSFREMLENENMDYVLPHVNTITEGVNIYRQHYSEEDEKKFGVIAIRITKDLDNKY